MTDSPVFPLERHPREFTSWHDLITAPPPDIEHYPDKLICVCEDQSIWPISPYTIVPDVQDMQMQFKSFQQEAEQNGVVVAAKTNKANANLANAWGVAALAVFCLVSVVIILIVLQSKIGQDFLNGVKF